MFVSVKKIISTFESHRQAQPPSIRSSSSSSLAHKDPTVNSPKCELESTLTHCISTGHLLAKPSSSSSISSSPLSRSSSAPSSPILKRAAGSFLSSSAIRLPSLALCSSHLDQSSLGGAPVVQPAPSSFPCSRHPSSPSLHLASEKSSNREQKKEGQPRSKIRDSWPSSHVEVRRDGRQRCAKIAYWEQGGSDFPDKVEQCCLTNSSTRPPASSRGVSRQSGPGVHCTAEFPQTRREPLLTSSPSCRTASPSRPTTIPPSRTGPHSGPTGLCRLENQLGTDSPVLRKGVRTSIPKALDPLLHPPPSAHQSNLIAGRGYPMANLCAGPTEPDTLQPPHRYLVTPRLNHVQAQCHATVQNDPPPNIKTQTLCGSDSEMSSSASAKVQGFFQNSNPRLVGSQTPSKLPKAFSPVACSALPAGELVVTEKVKITAVQDMVDADPPNTAKVHGSIHIAPQGAYSTASTLSSVDSSQCISDPQRLIQGHSSRGTQAPDPNKNSVSGVTTGINQVPQRHEGADGMNECWDSQIAEHDPHTTVTHHPCKTNPLGSARSATKENPLSAVNRSPSAPKCDPVKAATCFGPTDSVSPLNALSQQNTRCPMLVGPMATLGPKALTRNSDKAFLSLLLFIHSGSSNSMIAIDNKIEQAMDLVKTHLMMAVREEVEVLREQIKELTERNAQLERENYILRALQERD
ncbi:TSC22 domain family protein 1 isoform X1 [Brienomyrus brachyistius]|uniref:TSC22 domain family protein 1 isoform X1 n=1 Tax=Brienomyrus brachyistius TaxID=42636 RepID=UPI0020B219A0|nr:TSC22 domain family protein 1 isoform X1 [Brienomyrus brachyistius]